MTTSRYYIKQLTSAELGEAKTHEKYIRLTNDFPYEEFFQTEGYQNNSVTQIDFTAYDKDNANEAISLKFIYYSNSNKEKRIPSIGNIFDARGVKVDDVVVLESVTTNGETKIYISFKSQGCITLNPSTIYYTIVEDKQSRELVNGKDNLPLQQIYYGAPGTGKSYEIDQITQGESVVRTTFHPDSDYSTFVGAYKPTMEEVPVMTTIGTQYVSVKDSQGNPVTERRIEYNYIPQAFLQAYVKAWKLYTENPDNPKKQFLIIEEINRGNCAQIFGDLFQLLDRNEDGFSSYVVFADADIQKFIASQKLNIAELSDASGVRIEDKINSGELLSLPCNLYIWATMNTSDQSLFPIDSAFKRRWDWKYIPINPKKESWFIEVNGTNYSWTDFLEKINEEIGDTTSSEDKKLGFFFCKADGNKISADRFVSKVLFYIYNDVFKDYGFSKEFFKGEKGVLTFQTFYNLDGSINESNVEKILTNLGVSEAILEDEDNDSNEDLSTGTDDSTGHDRSKFSINGKGTYLKGTLVAEVARKYVADHPKLSVDEVYAAWKGLGLNRPSRFLQTQEEYDKYIATSTDPNKQRRQTAITCGDGQNFYVSSQWNLTCITAFIKAVNAQGWGITIQKIEE